MSPNIVSTPIERMQAAFDDLVQDHPQLASTGPSWQVRADNAPHEPIMLGIPAAFKLLKDEISRRIAPEISEDTDSESLQTVQEVSENADEESSRMKLRSGSRRKPTSNWAFRSVEVPARTGPIDSPSPAVPFTPSAPSAPSVRRRLGSATEGSLKSPGSLRGTASESSGSDHALYQEEADLPTFSGMIGEEDYRVSGNSDDDMQLACEQSEELQRQYQLSSHWEDSQPTTSPPLPPHSLSTPALASASDDDLLRERMAERARNRQETIARARYSRLYHQGRLTEGGKAHPDQGFPPIKIEPPSPQRSARQGMSSLPNHDSGDEERRSERDLKRPSKEDCEAEMETGRERERDREIRKLQARIIQLKSDDPVDSDDSDEPLNSIEMAARARGKRRRT